MALIDLKTNLKSLKYESGNKPFVTKDIENPPSSSRVVQEATRRVDDVSRVTQAILPTNSRFLENQAKLEQINFSQKVDGIKVAQGKTTAGAILEQAKDTVKTVSEVAASLIAQTAAAGTGVHLVRGFEKDGKKTYGNEALANGEVSLPNYNPQTELKDLKDYGGVNKYNISGSYLGKNQDLQVETAYANQVQENQTLLLPKVSSSIESKDSRLYSEAKSNEKESLLEGDSNLTTITKYANYVVSGSKVVIPELDSKLEDTDTNLINYKDLASKQFTLNELTGLPEVSTELELKVRDFRQGKHNTISFDYSANTINKELRVGLGNKGYWKKPVDYTQTRSQAIDRVNYQDVAFQQLDGVGVSESSVKDLIKFRFEVLTPGQAPAFLYFRAFLNSFDDSYTGEWESTKYIGRGDKMRTYNGFSRQVNLSFNIVATTRAEMKPLYKKMVYLASTTAPTYDSSGTFMKGTIVKLTVGSYLYELPGTIDSVKYTWQEKYPWEIAMQNPERGIDDDMQELPQMMDCSISFTPIHNFTPETGLKHYITNPNTSGRAQPFF